MIRDFAGALNTCSDNFIIHRRNSQNQVLSAKIVTQRSDSHRDSLQIAFIFGGLVVRSSTEVLIF